MFKSVNMNGNMNGSESENMMMIMTSCTANESVTAVLSFDTCEKMQKSEVNLQ